MYKTLVNFLQGWVGTNLISRRQPEEDSVDSEAAFPFFFFAFFQKEKKILAFGVKTTVLWRRQLKNNTSLLVPSVTSIGGRVICDDALGGELLFYIYHAPNAITHTELLESGGWGWDRPSHEYIAGDESEPLSEWEKQIYKCPLISADSSLWAPGLWCDLYENIRGQWQC